MTERRARCAAAGAGARARCSVELALVAGRAPEWITLLTPGALNARDGRRWRLDDAAAVLAATRARAGTTDLVVDYEHQSEYAARNGQPAPAAGWIRELAVGEDGALRARVEWTERARAAIGAREYRYVSPVFTYRAQDGQVSAVLSAAITNTPALDLPALARDTREDTMPEYLKALLKRLGLDPDALDEAGVAAATARLDAGLDGETRTALATALGLDAAASGPDLVAGATARQPDPSRYVPRAQFDELKTEVADLRATDTEREVAAAVDAATAAGKLTPAQREWATAYARSDMAGFQTYIDAAPVLLAGGGRTLPAPSPGTLTEDERALCRQLGITSDAFLAERKALATGDAP